MPLISKKVISLLLVVLMMLSIMPVNALAAGEDTVPPAFVAGYPQNNPQSAGSRRIGITIKAEEAVQYCVVMLPDEAPAPTKEQVRVRCGADDQPAPWWTDSGGSKSMDISASMLVPQHGTNYDVYVVLWDDAGNLSELKKLDVTSPAPANLFAPGYPQVGAVQADGSKNVQIKVKFQNTEENKDGRVYMTLLPDGAAAPDIQQVYEGKDGTGTAAVSAASGTYTAGTEHSYFVTGAAGGTAYDLYLVADDTYYSTLGSCTDVSKLDVTTPPDIPNDKVCAIGTTEYATLKEAVAAAGTTATIKLLKSFTSIESIAVEDKNITFDLNGQTVNITTNDYQGLRVITGTVALTGSGALNVSGRGYGVWANNGAVTVTSASASDADVSYAASGTGVYAIGGSHITVQGNAYGAAHGVQADGMMTLVTVNGDVSNAAQQKGAVHSSAASILVKGNVTSAQGYGVYTDGGTITIEGNVTAGHVGAMAEGVGAAINIQGNLQASIFGAIISGNGNITVDGEMTVTSPVAYIRIGSEDKTKGQCVADPGKPGYLKYSAVGTSGVVWVKTTVSSITVSPSTIDVQNGTTQQFSAAVTGMNSPAQTVTWAVSGKNSISTNIDANGLLTVGADETAAALTVTATSTVDIGKSDTATVTVTGTPPAKSLEKDVTGVTTPSGASINATNITATVANSVNSQIVSLSVSAKASWKLYSDAACLNELAGTTMPLTVGANTAYIKVTAEDGSTKVYTLTVTRADVSAVPVTGIAVTGGTSITVKSGTLQLAANITPANATNQNVTWSIRSGSEYASINSSGLVTAKSDGTAMVRATAQDGSGIYGEKVVMISGQTAGGNNRSAGRASGGYVHERYIVQDDGQVTVDLTHGVSILSAAQMDKLIKFNRDEPVILYGNGYSITFPAGSLNTAGNHRSYDFGIRFNMGANYGAIRSLMGDGFILMLDFNHSGALPGEAQIRIYLGAQYAGQLLYYDFYNPQTGNLEYMQAVTVDKDGYGSVRQSRCSAYVFGQHGYDEMGEIPKTGDERFNIWGWLLCAVSTSSLAVLIVTAKRRKIKWN